MTKNFDHKVSRITDATLSDMIDSLQAYKDKGVVDPWYLSDGRIVEPLDILRELQEFRKSR